MGEEDSKRVEESAPESAPPPPAPEPLNAASEEKEEKADDAKALVAVDKVSDTPVQEKSSGTALDRDAALARVATDKKISLIKAWVESEKAKAENKAQKKMSSICSWENSKKATIEAQLKTIEEAYEKKKAIHAEKMKNKAAMIHKEAEEKRASVEAKRGEDLLKAEESAAKYRAAGIVPKKALGCFGP